MAGCGHPARRSSASTSGRGGLRLLHGSLRICRTARIFLECAVQTVADIATRRRVASAVHRPRSRGSALAPRHCYGDPRADAMDRFWLPHARHKTGWRRTSRQAVAGAWPRPARGDHDSGTRLGI
jgi:hypothetical protein